MNIKSAMHLAPFSLDRLGVFRKQEGHRHIEGIGDNFDRPKSSVTFTTLYRANVCPVQAAPLRKRLLR